MAGRERIVRSPGSRAATTGLAIALLGCGGPETTDTTGPGIGTLDSGPPGTGTSEDADDTMGMRLDVPASTGVADDGQTTGECASQSLEADLELRAVDVLVVIEQLDVRFGCDVGFEPAG